MRHRNGVAPFPAAQRLHNTLDQIKELFGIAEGAVGENGDEAGEETENSIEHDELLCVVSNESGGIAFLLNSRLTLISRTRKRR